MFTISSAVLSSCIYVASGKIVFNLSIINTFSFSFKRLLIATTACLVCGFVLLFFLKKWLVHHTVSLNQKIVVKEEISKVLVEIHLRRCYHYYYHLVFYLLFQADLSLEFFKLQDVVVFLNLLLTASS